MLTTVQPLASAFSSACSAPLTVLDSWKQAAKQSRIKRLSVGSPLGHEARAFSYTTKGVTVYILVWRYGNLKARVVLGGLPSLGATSQQATRLALKQQAHMRR